MYGAGDAHLGNVAGPRNGLKGAQRGADIKQRFFDANQAYAYLVEELEGAYKANGGWLLSIDNRPFYPSSKKDCLNTCLQGNSAIVFKQWVIRCHDKIEDLKKGYANQMLLYHDESQFAYNMFTEEFNPECFGQKVCKVAEDTGKELGIKVPITADYDCGFNYAQCH